MAINNNGNPILCTKINPGDIWSKQHYSQSCYTACLAMLLKNHQIKIDDRDIVRLVDTPILIELDLNTGRYTTSFQAYQEQIQSIVCAKHRLSYRYLNSTQVSKSNYINYIIKLLKNSHEPIIVGVKSELLPDFKMFRDKYGESHAIVVYDYSRDGFHCLNPATICCVKHIDQDFDTVKHQVNFTITDKELQKASIEQHIGFIDDAAGTGIEDLDLILQSADDIREWSLKLYENVSFLYTGNSSNLNNYQLFRQKYINPFTDYMRLVIKNEFSDNQRYTPILQYLNKLNSDYIKIESEAHRLGDLNPDLIEKVYLAVNKCSNDIGNELKTISQRNKSVKHDI